jgi:hypothetical protein
LNTKPHFLIAPFGDLSPPINSDLPLPKQIVNVTDSHRAPRHILLGINGKPYAAATTRNQVYPRR